MALWTLNYTDRKENRAEADVPWYATSTRQYPHKSPGLPTEECIHSSADTSTVEDFLSMVCTEKCHCIVSLDDENSTDKSVAQYLPAVGETSNIGQYQIQCNYINTCDNYIVKDVVIFKSPSDQLNIQHYQQRKWKADDLVPSSTEVFITLVTDVVSAENNRQINSPDWLPTMWCFLCCFYNDVETCYRHTNEWNSHYLSHS